MKKSICDLVFLVKEGVRQNLIVYDNESLGLKNENGFRNSTISVRLLLLMQHFFKVKFDASLDRFYIFEPDSILFHDKFNFNDSILDFVVDSNHEVRDAFIEADGCMPPDRNNLIIGVTNVIRGNMQGVLYNNGINHVILGAY